MKPAVKPADIAVPEWLQRIGTDGISRIQARIAQIHNSLLRVAVWKYVPFQRAFDAIAIELSNDPEFGQFYFQIRRVVVDLANELEWIRPEWLTQFDPNKAFPMISWEASILRTFSGKRWLGAYTDEWALKEPFTSTRPAEPRRPAPNIGEAISRGREGSRATKYSTQGLEKQEILGLRPATKAGSRNATLRSRETEVGFETRAKLASSGVAKTERTAAAKSTIDMVSIPRFPERALWLKERLWDRSWNKHDVSRHLGPDYKTVQKVLDGLPVREDVLEKLATALSKKFGIVAARDIPRG